MQISQPIQPADIAEAVRRILERHLRMLDGRCRGCFVDYSKMVPHPRTLFDWATRVQARDMTAQFLGVGALFGGVPAKPETGSERLSA